MFDDYAYQSYVWGVMEGVAFCHILVEEGTIVVCFDLVEYWVFGLVGLDEYFALLGAASCAS